MTDVGRSLVQHGHAILKDAPGYEELYATLLDASPFSVLLIDPRQRIVLANRNFLEKSRHREADILGQPISTIFSSAILEQIGLVSQVQAAFAHHEATRGRRMTYRAPGLVARTYYYSVIPISRDDAITHVMLLLEDITEQVRLSNEVRLVERHLASVVESANDIVLSTDVEGRILTWNAAAERLSGHLRDEVFGRLFSELCVTSYQASIQAVFQAAGSKGKFGTAEWDLITKQGALIPIAWVGSPMKDDLGHLVAIVLVGRDLTERRKFEAQLLQSQKLSALGVLAGGIAHEIRNPLAISSSAAQFLAEDPKDPAFRKECVEKIQEGINRASLIIENLLRFARPGAQISTEVVNLSSLLGDTVKLAANQAQLQQVKIILDLSHRPLEINGVPSMLQQVFLDLILNAVGAMPNGGRLRIDLARVESKARIRFADTGHGIAAADVDRIFDPFFTTRPVGQGTGLGLSIAYSIMQQHLGTIEVESTQGEGATFTVWIPLP